MSIPQYLIDLAIRAERARVRRALLHTYPSPRRDRNAALIHEEALRSELVREIQALAGLTPKGRVDYKRQEEIKAALATEVDKLKWL